jgi:hypothetical protein
MKKNIETKAIVSTDAEGAVGMIVENIGSLINQDNTEQPSKTQTMEFDNPHKAIAMTQRSNKFKKIKELSDLTDALDSEQLRGTITDMPSGNKIWELLSTAISNEIDGVLGDQQALSAASETLAASLKNLGQLATGISSLATSISALSDRVVQISNADVMRALSAVAGAQRPQQRQQTQQQPTTVTPTSSPSSNGLPIVGDPNATVDNAW